MYVMEAGAEPNRMRIAGAGYAVRQREGLFGSAGAEPNRYACMYLCKCVMYVGMYRATQGCAGLHRTALGCAELYRRQALFARSLIHISEPPRPS